jgi:hypothetical protein
MSEQYQYPTDFNGSFRSVDIVKIFESFNFYDGRMIGGSKTGYRQKYPDNLVVFNANIVVKEHGKIWYGDLDLTKDYKILKQISERLNTVLYVLWEMDARFGEENNETSVLISKAIWNTNYLPTPTLKWLKTCLMSQNAISNG